MSDTPETDAVIKNVGDGPYIAYLVHFARKLERERDEARQELAIVKKQLEAVEGLMLDLDEKLQEERKHNAELYDEVARYESATSR